MQPGNFVPHLDGVDAPQGSDNPAARFAAFHQVAHLGAVLNARDARQLAFPRRT